MPESAISQRLDVHYTYSRLAKGPHQQLLAGCATAGFVIPKRVEFCASANAKPSHWMGRCISRPSQTGLLLLAPFGHRFHRVIRHCINLDQAIEIPLSCLHLGGTTSRWGASLVDQDIYLGQLQASRISSAKRNLLQQQTRPKTNCVAQNIKALGLHECLSLFSTSIPSTFFRLMCKFAQHDGK